MSLKRTGLTALTSYLQLGSSMAASLLLIRQATIVLPPEEFGLWSFIFGSIGYFLLLDFGVSASLARIFAEPVATGNSREISGWLYLVMAILAVQGLLIALLGLALREPLLGWFRISDTLLPDARKLWDYSLLVQGISMPARVLPGILHGQNRVYLINIVNSIIAWVNLGLFCLFLAHGRGVLSYVDALIYSTLLMIAGNACCVFLGKNRIKLVLASLPTRHLRELFTYSSAIFGAGIASQISGTAQTMILTRVLGLDAAAIFNVTSKMPILSMQLAWRAIDSFYPRWVNMFASGKIEQTYAEYLPTMRATLLVVGAIATGALLANPIFVGLWTRPDFYAGQTVTFWLGLVIIALTLNRCTSVLFQMHKRMGHYTFFIFATVLLEVGLGFVFARVWGLPGVPFASVLANLVFLGAFQTWHACRLTGLPLVSSLWGDAICLASALLLGFTSNAILEYWLPDYTLQRIALAVVFGAVSLTPILIRGGFLIRQLRAAFAGPPATKLAQ